ncbi:hypothetical protein [Corynebacterium aquilae]|uniref:Uncharacterized protein n=1 Tax=Corynebacterium aquilae DSM 44791 TaxID=1431546 RepID=A0A1L7CG83_9CORY|nr:hypothetical protein [Corynebacterium aquilae]APT84835.1 hypothetical protein CAQU_06870 [Corynebacterium aquilae DSM 44791]
MFVPLILAALCAESFYTINKLWRADKQPLTIRSGLSILLSIFVLIVMRPAATTQLAQWLWLLYLLAIAAHIVTIALRSTSTSHITRD